MKSKSGYGSYSIIFLITCGVLIPIPPTKKIVVQMVSCIICQDPAPCSQLPIAPLGNLKLVEDSLMSVELIMVLWLVTLPPPADAPPPLLTIDFP